MSREQDTIKTVATGPTALEGPKSDSQIETAGQKQTTGQLRQVPRSTRRPARAAENRIEKRPRGATAALVVVSLVIGFVAGGLVVRQRNRAFERQVVVAVNGVPITKNEFYSRMEGGAGNPAISQLVKEELQYQYAKSKGLAATEREVEQRFERSRKSPDFSAKLAQLGQSPESFKQALKVSLSQLKTVSQGVQVTDAELRQYYAANIDKRNPNARFYKPEIIQIQVILTRTRPEAEAALSRLSSESFEVVAMDKSFDDSKYNGGKIPPFERGRTPLARIPGLEDEIFKMRIGSTVGPRFYGKAWWIIRCLNRTSAKWPKFEDAKEECRDALLQQKGNAKNGEKIREEYAAFVKKARIQAFWPRYKEAATQAR
jgi:foldase protein PrsA